MESQAAGTSGVQLTNVVNPILRTEDAGVRNQRSSITRWSTIAKKRDDYDSELAYLFNIFQGLCYLRTFVREDCANQVILQVAEQFLKTQSSFTPPEDVELSDSQLKQYTTRINNAKHALMRFAQEALNTVEISLTIDQLIVMAVTQEMYHQHLKGQFQYSPAAIDGSSLQSYEDAIHLIKNALGADIHFQQSDGSSFILAGKSMSTMDTEAPFNPVITYSQFSMDEREYELKEVSFIPQQVRLSVEQVEEYMKLYELFNLYGEDTAGNDPETILVTHIPPLDDAPQWFKVLSKIQQGHLLSELKKIFDDAQCIAHIGTQDIKEVFKGLVAFKMAHRSASFRNYPGISKPLATRQTLYLKQKDTEEGAVKIADSDPGHSEDSAATSLMSRSAALYSTRVGTDGDEVSMIMGNIMQDITNRIQVYVAGLQHELSDRFNEDKPPIFVLRNMIPLIYSSHYNYVLRLLHKLRIQRNIDLSSLSLLLLSGAIDRLNKEHAVMPMQNKVEGHDINLVFNALPFNISNKNQDEALEFLVEEGETVVSLITLVRFHLWEMKLYAEYFQFSEDGDTVEDLIGYYATTVSNMILDPNLTGITHENLFSIAVVIRRIRRIMSAESFDEFHPVAKQLKKMSACHELLTYASTSMPVSDHHNRLLMMAAYSYLMLPKELCTYSCNQGDDLSGMFQLVVTTLDAWWSIKHDFPRHYISRWEKLSTQSQAQLDNFYDLMLSLCFQGKHIYKVNALYGGMAVSTHMERAIPKGLYQARDRLSNPSDDMHLRDVNVRQALRMVVNEEDDRRVASKTSGSKTAKAGANLLERSSSQEDDSVDLQERETQILAQIQPDEVEDAQGDVLSEIMADTKNYLSIVMDETTSRKRWFCQIFVAALLISLASLVLDLFLDEEIKEHIHEKWIHVPLGVVPVLVLIEVILLSFELHVETHAHKLIKEQRARTAQTFFANKPSTDEFEEGVVFLQDACDDSFHIDGAALEQTSAIVRASNDDSQNDCRLWDWWPTCIAVGMIAAATLGSGLLFHLLEEITITNYEEMTEILHWVAIAELSFEGIQLLKASKDYFSHVNTYNDIYLSRVSQVLLASSTRHPLLDGSGEKQEQDDAHVAQPA